MVVVIPGVLGLQTLVVVPAVKEIPEVFIGMVRAGGVCSGRVVGCL